MFFLMATPSARLRGSLWNQPLLSLVQNHIVSYPTPSNLTGNWNWGVLAGMCLVLQILTGIFLAMHYTAHVDLAFYSVQHLMRDVPSGWLLRYLHANGASLFFIVVYMHLFRGIYFTSYAQPREAVWLIGVVILLLMILTAFIGYVLPWGQMSLWGATVITSLASAIPLVGNHIVAWLWGSFSVDNPTLNRFYSFHYLFPFLLAALSLVHLAALHQYGSTNPLGVNAQTDLVDFYPYFYVKDLVAVLALSLFAAFIVGFYPEVLGHPDNNIPANPYSTPAHIVPEWYFLWVYAILRSIPNKLAGVVAILLVFVCLAILPYAHKPSVRSPQFRTLHQNLAWAFFGDFLLLTYLGHQPVEAPYVFLGQGATVLFFFLLGAMCVSAFADSYLAGTLTPITKKHEKKVSLSSHKKEIF
jgi:ubiquinol-cytochrome c reductase cytochrome b subunit